MDVLSRDVTLAALTAAQRGLGQRKELIAQNIANINTPGYKRRDVEFVDTLARALEGPHSNRAAKAASLGNVVAREIIEERLFYRVDMSGVDLDREMAEFAKVQLQSSAVSQLIYKKIRQYRTVIKDGRV